MRIHIVSSDPVTRVLTARLIERLGHPPARVSSRYPGGDAAVLDCDVLLFDADDEHSHEAAEILHRDPRPRMIAMSAGNDAGSLAVDALVRKPLSAETLADALRAAKPAQDFNRASWDELLQLFGRDGLQQMIAALEHDLPQQQQALDTALREQDRRAIARIAHGLRGVTLQFGAQSLAAQCSEVEISGVGAAELLERYAAFVQQLSEAHRGH